LKLVEGNTQNLEPSSPQYVPQILIGLAKFNLSALGAYGADISSIDVNPELRLQPDEQMAFID
jgi:hypothetical protein